MFIRKFIMSESMSWYELLGWEATADRDLTASASPSRVTTVLEYSPDAYVVQNQPKVRVIGLAEDPAS